MGSEDEMFKDDPKRRYTLIGIRDLEDAEDFIDAIDGTAFGTKYSWPDSYGFERRELHLIGQIIVVWNNGPHSWYAMLDPSDTDENWLDYKPDQPLLPLDIPIR